MQGVNLKPTRRQGVRETTEQGIIDPLGRWIALPGPFIMHLGLYLMNLTAFNLYVWMYDGGQNTYNNVVCTLEPHDVGRRMAVDGSP